MVTPFINFQKLVIFLDLSRLEFVLFLRAFEFQVCRVNVCSYPLSPVKGRVPFLTFYPIFC